MRSRKEFKKKYCEKSGITEEFFDKHFVIVHCECDYESCSGWAVIENNPESIKKFNEVGGGKHESN